MTDQAAIIVSLIGAATTLTTFILGRWTAQHNGYALGGHPLFGRLKYMREIIIPRINVGHKKKTECARKFLAIKLETFEKGLKAWVANPEPMRSTDAISVIVSLIKEYEDRAIRAGVPEIFVHRFAEHNMQVVESTIDALSSIADSGMYSQKEKQAATLDILLYTFSLSIYSVEETIGSLNGELEKAIEGGSSLV